MHIVKLYYYLILHKYNSSDIESNRTTIFKIIDSLKEKKNSTHYEFSKKLVALTSMKGFLLNLYEEEGIFRCKIKL